MTSVLQRHKAWELHLPAFPTVRTWVINLGEKISIRFERWGGGQFFGNYSWHLGLTEGRKVRGGLHSYVFEGIYHQSP